MGHSKKGSGDQESKNVKRYQKAVGRGRKRKLFEEMMDVLPGLLAELVDEIATEEAELIASREVCNTLMLGLEV